MGNREGRGGGTEQGGKDGGSGGRELGGGWEAEGNGEREGGRPPPNHQFLPPLPAPDPPLMCAEKMVAVVSGKEDVLVCMDSVLPHDCCVSQGGIIRMS